MTTAKFPIFLRKTPEEDGRRGGLHPIRIGTWMFTPRSTGGDGTRNATLEHENQKIDLRYSSSIFEDFLHTMSMIQVEFGRRSANTTPTATTLGEFAGASSRV
ncbi:hypothetical protein [Streptomyces sp. H39-S7]|uniref:hypothetical protein n=1 Tax=Streptomyces sp. H39-S7 TaxID=3004357 RepID=UPI0022B05B32|nr:hypothetical protein [Streptomyces sp. H39-S7]MCZ4125718.1 hypothetical protein [Streptomyces sp. H39-S7]